MPVFEHVSRYPFPREQVFAWHQRPGAVTRLMPPGMATVLSPPTDGINAGSQVMLRITHPLLASIVMPGQRGVGVRWLVEHTELVPGERFVDEQVHGPFKLWRHEHLFADGPAGSTVITDRITWELPVRLPSGFDQALLEMQLDGLLLYRERQLRDDLTVQARLPQTPAHVVVTGSSGLIGRQLCALLTTNGHRVTRLVRGIDTDATDDIAVWNPAWESWIRRFSPGRTPSSTWRDTPSRDGSRPGTGATSWNPGSGRPNCSPRRLPPERGRGCWCRRRRSASTGRSVPTRC